MPRPKRNVETESIRRLIDARLAHRSMEEMHVLLRAGTHLDEDALSAFVEGRLGERESAPLVSHLVACGSCRRITAQLIRLEDEFEGGPETMPAPVTEEGRGRLRRFLAELSERVLPSSEEDAVFAYHAPAEDFEKPAETETESNVQEDETAS